ncbi:hypothetical protein GCM10010423_04390 [Streptomyces levis]|uniref:Uncharacterized protein n=1 Tax=Streptomyces levis TaxID=285566 RepID=A0ABN3NBP1_9ACTN
MGDFGLPAQEGGAGHGPMAGAAAAAVSRHGPRRRGRRLLHRSRRGARDARRATPRVTGRLPPFSTSLNHLPIIVTTHRLRITRTGRCSVDLV